MFLSHAHPLHIFPALLFSATNTSAVTSGMIHFVPYVLVWPTPPPPPPFFQGKVLLLDSSSLVQIQQISSLYLQNFRTIGQHPNILVQVLTTYLKFLTRTLRKNGKISELPCKQAVTHPLWNNTTMVQPSNVTSSILRASVAIMTVVYVV